MIAVHPFPAPKRSQSARVSYRSWERPHRHRSELSWSRGVRMNGYVELHSIEVASIGPPTAPLDPRALRSARLGQLPLWSRGPSESAMTVATPGDRCLPAPMLASGTQHKCGKRSGILGLAPPLGMIGLGSKRDRATWLNLCVGAPPEQGRDMERARSVSSRILRRRAAHAAVLSLGSCAEGVAHGVGCGCNRKIGRTP